jgi:hypothetical protein
MNWRVNKIFFTISDKLKLSEQPVNDSESIATYGYGTCHQQTVPVPPIACFEVGICE